MPGVREIIDAYYRSELQGLAVPPLLMRQITSENVDEVIDMLPEKLRALFVRWIRTGYVNPDQTPANLSPDSATGSPTPQEALEAVRAWAKRNPVD